MEELEEQLLISILCIDLFKMPLSNHYCSTYNGTMFFYNGTMFFNSGQLTTMLLLHSRLIADLFQKSSPRHNLNNEDNKTANLSMLKTQTNNTNQPKSIGIFTANCTRNQSMISVKIIS